MIFEHFENSMKQDCGMKITREEWNSKDHYIHWCSHFNEFMEYNNGIEKVWFWTGSDWYNDAKRDVLAKDWYAI